MGKSKIIIVMSALNIGVAAFSTWLAYYHDSKGPFPVMVISIAFITFVSLLLFTQPERKVSAVDESSLRTALAGTVMIVYLVLVVLFSYFQYGSEEGMPLATQTLLTSFTSIVGVVVAFYFGASAYVEVNSRKSESLNKNEK